MYKFLFSNSKVTNIIYTIIYIALFVTIWKEYCVPIWGYMHYYYVDSPLSFQLFTYILTIIPILLYDKVKNVSSFISFIIYIFVYIPSMLGLMLSHGNSDEYNVQAYLIVMFLCMCLFFLADKHSIKINISRNRPIPVIAVVVLAAIITFFLLYTYSGRMRFVGLADIYTLRAENSSVVSGFWGYLEPWARSFFYPFLFVYGYLKKRWPFMAFGIAGFVMLFTISASKGTLLSPLIMLFFLKLYDWQQKYNFNIYALAIFGLSLLISIALLWYDSSPFIGAFATVFLQRSITCEGWLIAGWYVPFFKDHPYTYFTSINAVRAIGFDSPYGDAALGEVVSEGGMNANANFWCMDGIAGAGPAGIIIISLIIYFYFIFMNGLSKKTNMSFLLMMLIIPSISLVNVSFFTYLLTFGILWVIIAALYVKF